jgi:hypothetical protein
MHDAKDMFRKWYHYTSTQKQTNIKAIRASTNMARLIASSNETW